MSKLWKAFLLTAVAALMTLALAGCAGNDTAQTNQADDDPTKVVNMDHSKMLIVSFSPTGNTLRAAEYIAAYTGASQFRIIPVEEYTTTDLNYTDETSRTYTEHESNARPEIKSKINNFDQYDIIFLGYPIWFDEAPGIIYTFLDEYDFTGKTIIPFCTSSSSSIRNSVNNLEGQTPGATWVTGMRFPSDVTDEEVRSWITNLKITATPGAAGNSTSGTEGGASANTSGN